MVTGATVSGKVEPSPPVLKARAIVLQLLEVGMFTDVTWDKMLRVQLYVVIPMVSAITYITKPTDTTPTRYGRSATWVRDIALATTTTVLTALCTLPSNLSTILETVKKNAVLTST